MSEGTILKKVRDLVKYSQDDPDEKKMYPDIVKAQYSFLPVDVPTDFLQPLPDPSSITVKKIDFVKEGLPEYKTAYAVVLDGIMNEEECKQLIHLAEMSAGAHRDDVDSPPKNSGWRPAMVNAGRDREFFAKEYRNSDRILWDHEEVVHRLWQRILQGEGMKEYFTVLEGDEYMDILGSGAVRRGERWRISEQGPNERMRFLKYGEGQFFRRHNDGTYETPDHTQRSYYTMHLYLNDSAQVLGLNEPIDLDAAIPSSSSSPSSNPEEELLQGGATTFHSNYRDDRLDVHPKTGRVLIFQQRGMLHSGDDVTKGIKYTMRSDLMYTFDDREEERGRTIFLG
ncbi:hypothetical protein B0J14DRAFT_27211 [Halenospora varia]|nr:hypothetical protein B0J14DRAFT_27211 [Halenospora varia]